ncbi:hypothetical protein ES705_33278 [subsurface metagenome]
MPNSFFIFENKIEVGIDVFLGLISKTDPSNPFIFRVNSSLII